MRRFFLILYGLLLLPTVVLAQFIPASGVLGSDNNPVCNFATGNIGFACIPIYIGYIIQVLLGFAGGFFLFGIIIAGYKYMFGSITAQGTEAGKKEIIASLIGFVIIVLSYLLVDTIIEALT